MAECEARGVTDPNWLLSTTAQSAAALVAIVGGFLVSRLVSLASDRLTLERRLDELQGHLEIESVRLEVVRESRRAVSEEWLEDLALTEIVSKMGKISVDEVLAEFVPRGATRDEMSAAADDLIAAVNRVFAIVEATGATNRLTMIGKKHGFGPLDERDDRILNEIRSQRGGGYLPAASIGDGSVEIERQERRIAQEEELTASVRALQAEEAVVKRQLRSLAAPPRLRLAVAVLVYFAIVGIVVPLFFMTKRPVPDSSEFRLTIVGLFISGLAGLLLYLGSSIGSLRWADPQERGQSADEGAPGS